MDRTDHTERAGRGGQNSQIRRRPPVRAAGGKAPGKPFKLNYRGANIAVKVTRGRAEISCDGEVPAVVCGKNVVLSGDTVFEI